MKAVQLFAHGQPGDLRLVELAEPRPARDEVVVRVRACGLNRLDLWAEQGSLPISIQLPRTPGGEIAGEIDAVGEEAKQWRVGDRVAVQSNLFCGECEFCRAGDESLCLRSELLGVQREGGFAEKVAVPARALVRLPEAVSFIDSAALTLAGSTAMHMLTRRARVTPGQTVLVIAGASGVGSAAIQIARSLGARVIATTSSEAKRHLCRTLGAEEVVDAKDPEWPTEVRRWTNKRGVDWVVEHVGGVVLESVFSCVARGGTVVTCGATAGRDVRLNLWPFFVKEQRLVGSYGRTRADMLETLAWTVDGRLRAVVEEVLPLDRAVEGFARLRNRTVLGKLVIQP